MIDAAQILRSQNPQAYEVQRNAYSAVDTQKTGETGRAMGYALRTVPDPGESLADSMEELSMSFEEKKLDDIGKRRLGELRGKSSLMTTMIDRWMKTLPDLPGPERFERLLRSVRQLLAEGGTPEDLLHLLDEESDDATGQYAALDILENAGLDEASKKLVLAAKRLLERTKGEEIRAGLNLAEVVNARSSDAAGLQELRRLYRNEVLGYRTPQDCFRALLSQRGAEGLRVSIGFLVEACGVDLQSATPSKSKEELARILGDLQCVSTLTAALDRADALVAKMSRQFGEACALDGTMLTERLIALTEKAFADRRDMQSLMQTVGIQQLLAKLYFMTTLQGVVRQFSSRLFADEEARRRLVDAAQEVLDDLVAEQQQRDEERERQEGGRS